MSTMYLLPATKAGDKGQRQRPATKAGDATAPIVAESLVFAEQNGLVAVEAEHFVRQELRDVRAFHITSFEHTPDSGGRMQWCQGKNSEVVVHSGELPKAISQD